MRFAKVHACGNDFLVVEGECDPPLAVKLCARTTGIGADGVEFLSWTGDRDALIRLVNADGSIAEISGNGTRCVAAWIAHARQVPVGEIIHLETDAGLRECSLVTANAPRFEFASGMGVPEVEKRKITLCGGTVVDGTVVLTGNPHFVIAVEDDTFEAYGRAWQDLGREICFHPDFPEQTNVEFVHILDTNTIEIRIFERGVGPTLSSGTGSCATAAAAMARYGASASLRVRAPGGEQCVQWAGGESEMILTGPAELIAAGEAW